MIVVVVVVVDAILRDLPCEGAGDNRLNETSTEEKKKKGNNEIINLCYNHFQASSPP